MEAIKQWNVWHDHAKQWEANEDLARPPKEDPLWIRKGDEMRNVARHGGAGVFRRNLEVVITFFAGALLP
jgi:hypothetical protein